MNQGLEGMQGHMVNDPAIVTDPAQVHKQMQDRYFGLKSTLPRYFEEAVKFIKTHSADDLAVLYRTKALELIHLSQNTMEERDRRVAEAPGHVRV